MRARQAAVALPLLIMMLVILPPLVISPLSEHHWVHALSAGLILAAVPGAVLFPLMYAKARWWTTHLGRAVMMMAIGIGGIIFLSAIRVAQDWPTISDTFAGDPLPVDLFRLAVFMWLFVAIYYKTYALYAVNKRGQDLHSDDADIRSSDPAEHPEQSSA